MHFLKRRSAVSLACPGRQWHAEVAHAAAGLNDCLSITVQNAYMTAGYTYTKPTGNYITAIDQWSKNVFVKDYGVPAATVKVISTPRFDYLRHLTAMDKQGARKRLKLGANTPFVFFAAQVGFDDETKTIVRTLATLNVSEGLGVECIVKLHPRTPDEVIVQCEHVANMANANHNIKVTKDGEIADYLVASDVVITIFSNVGIEAAVVGRNLIIAKFSDAPLPIPMDEFGIGYVAKDGKMLRDGITAFLEDTDFAKKYKDLQDVYRDENPSMVLGNSAEILTDVVEKAMDGNF